MKNQQVFFGGDFWTFSEQIKTCDQKPYQLDILVKDRDTLNWRGRGWGAQKSEEKKNVEWSDFCTDLVTFHL